ncbi:MAG: glycosyltransferase family 2 protein [Candidatus Glassbacteria bacterium]|nr:glycosyltransferase family 2 protein [Candidatus Glassbacteria bacterium]
MEPPVDISVVIPVYNEVESVGPLYEKLACVLDKLGRSFEILFIDDGSTDGSGRKLAALHQRDKRVGVITFRRNFGKSAALDAGFGASRGELVFTMDADLQDDPDEMPAMIARLEEGYDLVSGWKHDRQDSLSKTLPSKLFNLVTSVASGLRLHDFNCGFKLYRGIVARGLKVYGELHRYLPALAHWQGYRVTEMKVRHHKRKFGRSKFGAGRLVKGYLDLITVVFLNRYTRSPLHFFGALGSLLCAGGFAIGLYFVGYWIAHHNIGGRVPLLLFAIFLMLTGFQLISTGLLGEMLTSSLYYEREPAYLVRHALPPEDPRSSPDSNR